VSQDEGGGWMRWVAVGVLAALYGLIAWAVMTR